MSKFYDDLKDLKERLYWWMLQANPNGKAIYDLSCKVVDEFSDEQNFINSYDEAANEIHETAKEKGWWNVQTAKQWIEKKYHVCGGPISISVAELDYSYEDMVKAYESGQKNPPRNISEMLMLIVSEIAEGMEGLRKDLDSDHITGFKMIEEELADVQIRIKDLAKAMNYRVAEAEIAKSEFNKTRPYKHGDKKF